MDRRTFLTLALAAPAIGQKVTPKQVTPPKVTPPKVTAPPPPRPATPQWTQWGGPHRNFQTEAQA